MKEIKLSDLEELIKCSKEKHKIARDIVMKEIESKGLQQDRQRKRDSDEKKILNRFKKK